MDHSRCYADVGGNACGGCGCDTFCREAQDGGIQQFLAHAAAGGGVGPAWPGKRTTICHGQILINRLINYKQRLFYVRIST
jgi:hypothetical protein